MMGNPAFVKDKDLVGKTAKSVVSDGHRIYLAFTDGTYTGMSVTSDDEYATLDWQQGNLYTLLELGLLTREEYMARSEAVKKESDERRRKQRLAEYQKLKKEFEP